MTLGLYVKVHFDAPQPLNLATKPGKPILLDILTQGR